MFRAAARSFRLLSHPSPKAAQILTHSSRQRPWQNAQHRNCSTMPVGMGIRRQRLPPFPHIDVVVDCEVESLMKSNFRAVTYGDHEYKECLEGFVQVYAHADRDQSEPETPSCFVVVYGENHARNVSGPVERRQDEKHGTLYAILQTLNAIPENSFKKVCICVRESGVIQFVTRGVPRLSENSYRSVQTGRLVKDLDTVMEINKVLRTRQDLTLRMKYIPLDCVYPEALFAKRWAGQLAYDAHQAKKRGGAKLPDLLSMDY